MFQRAASPDFYSACLQIIMVGWLIIAVETRALRRPRGVVRKLLLFLAGGSFLATNLCIVELKGPPVLWAVGGDTFIASITAGVVAMALFSIVVDTFGGDQSPS